MHIVNFGDPYFYDFSLVVRLVFMTPVKLISFLLVKYMFKIYEQQHI